MKKVSFADIAFLVLSLILCLGSHFAFHACPAKSDGSWMVCHWAERVVTALSAVFVILSAARFFLEAKTKLGISISFLPLALVTALVPGIIVNLCMMKDMRCHTVMRPSVIVLSILICALSVVDILVLQKKKQ